MGELCVCMWGSEAVLPQLTRIPCPAPQPWLHWEQSLPYDKAVSIDLRATATAEQHP